MITLFNWVLIVHSLILDLLGMWCALYGLHNINTARLGRSPVPFVISGQWLMMAWSHLGSVWKLHSCRAAKYDIFGMPSAIAGRKLLEGD